MRSAPHARLQRRRAVRRLHVPGDAEERRALQCGQGLPHAATVARPNLKVYTGATDAARAARRPARGGRASAPGRATAQLRARREVIVSAGAFGSPQLLQLSGIGPGTRICRQGHRPGARPARRRRQPAGPHRLRLHLPHAQRHRDLRRLVGRRHPPGPRISEWKQRRAAAC